METNDTMENFTTVSYAEDHTLPSEDTGYDVSTRNAVVVMLSIFSVVGVIGNAIAFYIFFARRSTSTSVIFILALAGTDFFTCLVTIPYTIVFELLHYHLRYDMACKTYFFLITSTVPFSAYIMVGIALDRYFCICHPFLFFFTLARAKAVIYCMGIPAVVFGIITALSYGAYTENITDEDFPSNSTFSESADDFLHHSTISHFSDDTNMTTPMSSMYQGYGQCYESYEIISPEFLEVYKMVHALNFLVAYLAVAVLYCLIYKSIFTRRANKARKRKENNVHAVGGGNKFNQNEETQMTVINGGDCNSPKYGNKQMKKDATCARKITLTTRNEASVLNNAESQRAGLNAGTDSREEERVNLLDDNPDVWSNETNGNSSNVSTCNTNSTPCGMLTENEDGEDDDDRCSVYIGPHTYAKKMSSPSQNVLLNNEKSKDDAGVEAGAENNRVSSNSSDDQTMNLTTTESGEQHEDTSRHTLSPTRNDPEEKPLLSRSQISPATPPNSLALIPNMSKQMASQKEENKQTAGDCKRQQAAQHGTSNTQSNSVKGKRSVAVRDWTVMANIKTAFMLFIVTLVFIIAFLPALLMAHRLISLNLIIFYGYFIYNVANPFIYAFMNQTFRDDLKKLVSICRRRSS